MPGTLGASTVGNKKGSCAHAVQAVFLFTIPSWNFHCMGAAKPLTFSLSLVDSGTVNNRANMLYLFGLLNVQTETTNVLFSHSRVITEQDGLLFIIYNL